MRSAGFVDIDETDYTEQYHETLRGWRDHSAERSEELIALWGHRLFTERQADRRAAIEAVESGWQRRILISATRPHPRATLVQSGFQRLTARPANARAGSESRLRPGQTA